MGNGAAVRKWRAAGPLGSMLDTMAAGPVHGFRVTLSSRCGHLGLWVRKQA